MKVGPHVRRALHQALDIVLDAIAADERAAPAKKRTRGPAQPSVTMPADVTPEELAAAERTWARNGYRKTA